MLVISALGNVTVNQLVGRRVAVVLNGRPHTAEGLFGEAAKLLLLELRKAGNGEDLAVVVRKQEKAVRLVLEV